LSDRLVCNGCWCGVVTRFLFACVGRFVRSITEGTRLRFGGVRWCFKL
jgi:hypothetical protein